MASMAVRNNGCVNTQGEGGDGFRGALVALEHVDCLEEHDKGFLPALAALLPNAKVSHAC